MYVRSLTLFHSLSNFSWSFFFLPHFLKEHFCCKTKSCAIWNALFINQILNYQRLFTSTKPPNNRYSTILDLFIFSLFILSQK